MEEQDHDARSIIHIRTSSSLRRFYRIAGPLIALSLPFLLCSDRTGVIFEIMRALIFVAAPILVCGSCVSYLTQADVKGVRINGSRIFVDGANIAIHMTEVTRCRVLKHYDGSANSIVLDLSVPRFFWVPGVILGLSKSATFRVDEDTSDLAMNRIQTWVQSRPGDQKFGEPHSMRPFIRPATKQDAPALAAILNPIIERGGTTAYEDPVDAAYFEAMIAGLGPRDTLLVAEKDGRVVGYQLLDASDRLPADVASIASFVAIGTAAKGVGRAMAAETIRAARAAGWAEIDATIRADNQSGLAYYSRLGFQDHEVFRAVPLKDGTPVDRIAKRLRLTGKDYSDLNLC